MLPASKCSEFDPVDFSKCQDCQEGFGLNYQSISSCELCETHIEACFECHADQTVYICDECQQGYNLNTNNSCSLTKEKKKGFKSWILAVLISTDIWLFLAILFNHFKCLISRTKIKIEKQKETVRVKHLDSI